MLDHPAALPPGLLLPSQRHRVPVLTAALWLRQPGPSSPFRQRGCGPLPGALGLQLGRRQWDSPRVEKGRELRGGGLEPWAAGLQGGPPAPRPSSDSAGPGREHRGLLPGLQDSLLTHLTECSPTVSLWQGGGCCGRRRSSNCAKERGASGLCHPRSPRAGGGMGPCALGSGRDGSLLLWTQARSWGA